MNVAQAHFYQAVDTVMPKVNFLMTRSEQDAPEGGSASSDGVSSSLSRRVTPQKKFVFSQPIFSGFKEFAALEGSGAEKSQRRHELQRAKELLFVDVMEAFYALAQVRRDIEILASAQKTLGGRIEELTGRAKLGRSRDSEVQKAFSDLKTVEADLEQAKGAEILARQLLEFYIGKPVDGDLDEEENLKTEVSDVADYLTKAYARADVKAAEQAKVLAQKNVVVAQSGLFPTIKVDGNYYTHRVGFQSGIDWDVLLSIDVPVFTGTETIGEIKEAAANRETASLFLEKSKRMADLEIKNAFAEFKASGLVERALVEARDASKKSYELHAEEYKLNRVNNLEVLDALKQYEDIERRWNTARYQMLKNFWKLKVAVGEIS